MMPTDKLQEYNICLDYLATLQPGWYDGEGFAICPKSIAFARESLPLFVDLPKAGIFPDLEEAQVKVEWSLNKWAIDVVFREKDVHAGFTYCGKDRQQDNFEGEMSVQTLLILLQALSPS